MASSCFSSDYDPCDRIGDISNAENFAHVMSEENNPDDKDDSRCKADDNSEYK